MYLEKTPKDTGGNKMQIIRPILNLETNLPEITNTVHETDEPVFLTNNGYGDIVVMSMEAWEEMNFENEIYQKLTEAQAEARSNPKTAFS